MDFKFFYITNGSHNGKNLDITPNDWKKIFSFCVDRADSVSLTINIDQHLEKDIKSILELPNVKTEETTFCVINNVIEERLKYLFLFYLNKAQNFVFYLPLNNRKTKLFNFISSLNNVNIKTCEGNENYIEFSGKITNKLKEFIYNNQENNEFFQHLNIKLLSNNRQFLCYTNNILILTITDEEFDLLSQQGISFNSDEIGSKMIDINIKMSDYLKNIIYKFQEPYFYDNDQIFENNKYHANELKLFIKNRELLFIRAGFIRYLCLNIEELKNVINKNIDVSQWILIKEKNNYKIPEDTFTYHEYYGSNQPDETLGKIVQSIINKL